MSGTIATFPQPLRLDRLPPDMEGPKGVSVSIPWNAVLANHAYRARINLLSQFQSGQFTTLQSVWVDNATSPAAVQLTSLETGQRIRVGAFTQGWYPLLCGPAPEIDVDMFPATAPTGGLAVDRFTTLLHFLNVPPRPFESNAAQSGTGPQTSAFNAPVPGGVLNLLGPWTAAAAGANFLGTQARALVREISLTLWLPPAVTGLPPAGVSGVAIIESGGAFAGTLWQDGFQNPTAVNTAFYSRTIEFAVPLLQRDPASVIALYVPLTVTGGNVNAQGRIGYSTVLVN